MAKSSTLSATRDSCLAAIGGQVGYDRRCKRRWALRRPYMLGIALLGSVSLGRLS
jgi:hypothetical protein